MEKENKEGILKKLAEIQKKDIEVKKGGKNHHNMYARLEEDVLPVVMPILREKKILVINGVANHCLVTQLVDTEDGSKVESHFPLPEAESQKVAGAMTYGRRYNLTSLLNIVADTDDDGNSASGISNENLEF